jgi:hypothetical protein
MAPDLSQAMAGFSNSMQMAQIAEQIQVVQLAVEEVGKVKSMTVSLQHIVVSRNYCRLWR